LVGVDYAAEEKDLKA